MPFNNNQIGRFQDSASVAQNQQPKRIVIVKRATGLNLSAPQKSGGAADEAIKQLACKAGVRSGCSSRGVVRLTLQYQNPKTESWYKSLEKPLF